MGLLNLSLSKFIKENQILAEPFKIDCSWVGKLDSATLQQTLREHHVPVKGIKIPLSTLKEILNQLQFCVVAALCQSRATDLP